ncbi:MAG: hypothetical protein EOM24_27345 [Chloroflexia bacterium]|nr:hypothetical protein [Chloroflexia bacterium]
MNEHKMAKRSTKTARTSLPQPAGAEIHAIARKVDQLAADPKALKRVMWRAGIVTKKGKLTKEFGG